MMSFEEAFARITNIAPLAGIEQLPISSACQRVLGQDVVARLNQPPYAVSSMDGYAVRASDTEGQDSTLTVVGGLAAGDAPGRLEVAKGEAARIFTGAAVPSGADSVVIQENVTTLDNGQIELKGDVKSGDYVRPAAYDFSVNDTLLQEGQLLRSSDLSLAAAAGHEFLTLRRKPRVAVISTGNELVAPGTTPAPGQIIASNAIGVANLLQKFGAQPIDMGIARDDIRQLTTKFEEAIDAKADVIVTLGGASVGDHDLVRPALMGLGAQLDFWKVAVRPGKPLMFGQLESTQILGLPGNPVSSLVCAHIFLKPLVRTLLSQEASLEMKQAVLASPLPANGQRRHFMRAKLESNNGALHMLRPLQDQDSSLLSQLSKADALINVPPHQAQLPKGSSCEFLLLE